MRQLDTARIVLASLVEDVRHGRLNESKEDPGFTRLIDVIHDSGRSLAPRDPADARDLLPALAALRESLEDRYSPEAVAKSPFEALRGEKSTPYAAGALWAASAILYAALGRWDADEERGKAQLQRRPLRERVLEAFLRYGTMRPTDVRAELEAQGRSADKTAVSRCIGDLLESGEIAPTEPPATADRRHRYYRLRDQEATSRLAAGKAQRAVEELLTLCGPQEAKRLLNDAVEEHAGQSASVAAR